MKMNVCAAGDIELFERIPEDFDYDAITDIIKQCDVRITDLEAPVTRWDCFASSFCGGQWLNMTPENLEDIEKFGFNIFACANNHSMDYSFDGLMSTRRELSERGWHFAGIGKSLSESSSPVYCDVPRKNIKVAYISATSTFYDAARAGDERDGIPARPGINPLRYQTKYLVSGEHFHQLKEIASTTYINGERDNARRIGSLPPEEPESINFGGAFFVQKKGNEPEGKLTYCNPLDLSRILGEIKKAKENADYVFVSVHAHQIRRNKYTEPDCFVEEFAHKAIEAGADAIIGGGTHQLQPIEIYKEKPIF